MTFLVTVNSDVPTGTIISDTVVISSATVDPNPANNSAPTTTMVNMGTATTMLADVAVTKNSPTGPVFVGQTLDYTVAVTNNGPDLAVGVAVSDPTPPNTTFVSVVDDSEAGFSCANPGVGNPGLINCGLTNLASGLEALLTITVQIDGGTPNGSMISNLATIASNTTDTTPANNTSSVNTVAGSPPTNTPTPTATPTATLTAAATVTSTVTTTPTVTTTATDTPTTAVTPTATPNRIPGDINGDGFVDIRDYGVWRQNFGQTNCGNAADLNGDCLVDIRDYGIWRQHFGEGTPRIVAARRQRPGEARTPTPTVRRTPSAALPAGPGPVANLTHSERSAVTADRASEKDWSLLRAEGANRGVPGRFRRRMLSAYC